MYIYIKPSIHVSELRSAVTRSQICSLDIGCCDVDTLFLVFASIFAPHVQPQTRQISAKPDRDGIKLLTRPLAWSRVHQSMLKFETISRRSLNHSCWHTGSDEGRKIAGLWLHQQVRTTEQRVTDFILGSEHVGANQASTIREGNLMEKLSSLIIMDGIWMIHHLLQPQPHDDSRLECCWSTTKRLAPTVQKPIRILRSWRSEVKMLNIHPSLGGSMQSTRHLRRCVSSPMVGCSL